MNPWINIILLIPATLLLLTFFLFRIKSRLEGCIYKHRGEGIIIRTSLTYYRTNRRNGISKKSIGMALLTSRRIIIYDWRRKDILNYEINGNQEHQPTIEKKGKKYLQIEHTGDHSLKDVLLRVSNPEAWILEFGRIGQNGSP